MTSSVNAYNQAVRFLAPRARSIMETRNNLKRKGVEPGLIEVTLSRLIKEGILNDVEFADLFVESRQRFRPKSRFAIGYELKQKGISDNIIEHALSKIDERDAALRAVKTKTGQWQNLDTSTLKKKVMALLRNRGFSYEISISTYYTILENKKDTEISNEN